MREQPGRFAGFRLHGRRGTGEDQQYAIPSLVGVQRYSSVVIWRRAFSVTFAVAELEPS